MDTLSQHSAAPANGAQLTTVAPVTAVKRYRLNQIQIAQYSLPPGAPTEAFTPTRHRSVQETQTTKSDLTEADVSDPGEIIRSVEVLLQRAQQRGAELINSSKQTVDHQLTEARSQGRAEGIAEAAAQALELQRQFLQFVKNLESNALDLVLEIAEQVIGEHLTAHPESIRARISKALDYLQYAASAILVLHPDDLVDLDKKEVRSFLPSSITLESDPSLQRGVAVLRFGGCTIESSPAVHFKTIREQLKNYARLSASYD